MKPPSDEELSRIQSDAWLCSEHACRSLFNAGLRFAIEALKDYAQWDRSDETEVEYLQKLLKESK